MLHSYLILRRENLLFKFFEIDNPARPILFFEIDYLARLYKLIRS